MNGAQILDEVRELTGHHGYIGFSVVNDAYATILRRLGVWRTRVRDTTSLEFKADITSYQLPVSKIRRLEAVAVRNNEDEREWRTLTPATDDKFDEQVFANRNADGTDDKEVPRYYRVAGDSIEVTPTPDGTYPGRLIYIGEPPDIAEETVPVIPSNYHWVLAKLAAAYFLRLSDDQIQQGKATRLEGEVERAYLFLAMDTGNYRGDLSPPKLKIMRS